MDQSTILAILASAIVMGVGWVLLSDGDSKANRRKDAIVGREKKSIFSIFTGDTGGSRRKQVEASLQGLDAKNKNRAKANKTVKSKLIQADWSVSAEMFLTISLCIGGAVGLGCMAFGAKILITIGAAVVVGFGVPRWILNVAIKRRQNKFTASFSDAMDVIVRGIRTGLPLGDCLRIIAHESPEPVKTEFALVVEAEGVGVPIETCLERMYDRVPLSEVKFFATVLNIQRSTGGNLGEALANLSNVLRGRKFLREKIKALAAEAKASAMIIGILPPGVMLLVTVMAPDYMVELYTTERGHTNLMIGAGMMVTGTLVMRKMINFKF